MTTFYSVTTVTMPISSKITETYIMKNATLVGAFIPVVASTAATFVQVSSDPASASFARARLFPPNSGDISINTQAGSFYLSMVDVALAFPFVRFESNVFETASRSYVFVAKG